VNFSEFPPAETSTRTSYNTLFDGQKVSSHVHPELVGGGLLANLSAGANRLRRELSGHPWFERKQRFLQSTIKTEHPFHRPSEVIATTGTDRFGVFEVGA
jgi:hypothetical protein